MTKSFDKNTTADQVLAGVDLTGKRAIVTGASSGIGIETARALASKGADVTITVRNIEAGNKVAEEIKASTGNPNVHVAFVDLADRASIMAFVDSWTGPLHILVNNAGVMNLPELTLIDGWEGQFATNHIGHFLLTTGLHGALAAAGGARVVVVASGAHHMSPVVFDDINFDNREYHGMAAYGQSKTANILFAVEAARRWAGDKIEVNSLHPGSIMTGLHRHVVFTPEIQAIFDAHKHLEKTVEQGAATSILLAASPTVAGISGRYFEDTAEAVVNDDPSKGVGVASYAVDSANASKLWTLTEAALKA